MLKLKLQYFGHLMQRTDSFEKTLLMLGKIEGRRRRGQQRMRWLDGISDWWTWVCVNSGSWWWTGRPGMLQFMWSQRVRHDWASELNWTELYDPVLMLFDIHPKELKTYVQIKTYIDAYKGFIHNCQHLETTNTSFSILMNGKINLGTFRQWNIIHC